MYKRVVMSMKRCTFGYKQNIDMGNRVNKRERHGESKTPLFVRWSSMMFRVSPKFKGRKIYYDKGITVCDEWHMFSNFRDWALANGYEKGLELDRINNDAGYSPNNCRFVTKLVNNSNRSNTVMVEYKGTRVSLTLLCQELNLPKNQYNTIRRRISNGWSHEDAIETPLRTGNYGWSPNPERE
jgi:hypothetical protein